MGAIAAPVIGAVASGVVGNMMGGGGSSDDANAAGDRALAYAREAAGLWDELQLPNIQYAPYQTYSWLRDYQPETYDPYIGEVTQMSDDPAARAAQMAALDRLMQRGAGGLTDADRIGLNQIAASQGAAGTSAYRGAMDALAARGLAGQGADLAARLAANQQAANSASDLYDTAFRTALDRGIGADVAAGNLATGIRGQSADISSRMADINNKFNAQVQALRTQAAKDAADSRNQAQLINMQGRQNTANRAVDVANTNMDRQNSIAQQNFQNALTKLSGKSNALTGNATQAFAQQAALNKQALGESQNQMAGIGALFSGAKAVSDAGGFSKILENIFK